ncbi:MAG: phosphate ABC transporter permease subunit PstC [Clostridium sp.]
MMKGKNYWKNIKNEYLGRGFVTFCGFLIIFLTISIIAFLGVKGVSTFTKQGYPLEDFLFSFNWNPGAEVPSLGALTFIVGSALVSIGAVLLSTPIALSVAIFSNFISPKLGKKVIQPVLELFVGIPSVVYGLLGISLLVPLIRDTTGGIGFSLLAGILVLSVMILPTIATISSDAIKSVSRDYVEGSYGLGATRWQTIKNVVLPASKTGILTSIILGLARAFGEALAVQMVIGNSIKLPNSLFKPATTLTSIITMDMANTVEGTLWNDAIWSLALILLIISFLFIIITKALAKGEDV